LISLTKKSKISKNKARYDISYFVKVFLFYNIQLLLPGILLVTSSGTNSASPPLEGMCLGL
jgi:hypothetical protein